MQSRAVTYARIRIMFTHFIITVVTIFFVLFLFHLNTIQLYFKIMRKRKTKNVTHRLIFPGALPVALFDVAPIYCATTYTRAGVCLIE